MKKYILMLTLALILSSPALASHPNGTVYVDVNGPVCDFCAQSLEKVFGKEQAVDTIDVNFDTKVLTIHFKEGQSLDDKKISELVYYAGYTAEKIRY